MLDGPHEWSEVGHDHRLEMDQDGGIHYYTRLPEEAEWHPDLYVEPWLADKLRKLFIKSYLGNVLREESPA